MKEVTDRTSLFKQDSRLVLGGFLWYEWINKTGCLVLLVVNNKRAFDQPWLIGAKPAEAGFFASSIRSARFSLSMLISR
jgi:hypothetical protein